MKTADRKLLAVLVLRRLSLDALANRHLGWTRLHESVNARIRLAPKEFEQVADVGAPKPPLMSFRKSCSGNGVVFLLQ